MNTQKVDLFIMSNAKYFDGYQLQSARQQLAEAPEDKWSEIQVLPFKDPSIVLIISILIGVLGIDRFLIGDIKLGIGKLITFGGLGIWVVVDWFFIQQATREKNLQMVEDVLNN
jgi:hypothetical protein